MDRLWAPWRMAYIVGEAMSDRDKEHACVFCTLPVQGCTNYRENLILSCGQQAFVILNRYPYNNSHLMVVPRRHVADPGLLEREEYQVLTELLRRATAILWQALHPDGINLGMNLGRSAGAGIDEHCHYHVVPRWNGDTNFMPIVGQTKVISEDLWASYDRLYPLMRGLAEEVEAEVSR